MLQRPQWAFAWVQARAQIFQESAATQDRNGHLRRAPTLIGGLAFKRKFLFLARSVRRPFGSWTLALGHSQITSYDNSIIPSRGVKRLNP